MPVDMSACKGWNALLTEVLHMVLNGSSEEFCWQLRGMASSWAVAIRSFTKAQLVISAEQNTGHWAGVGQLFQFAQQRSHQYPSASFIIQPHQPLVPTACMKFLQGLADQGYEGANCKLAVTLDLTWVSLDATTAKGILQAALQLGAQGIVTRVSIVNVPAGLHSNGSWMETLAPILHKLQLYPVPALSASIDGQRPSSRGNYVSLDPSHWQHANQSLHTLCVREYLDQLYFWYKIPVLPHVLRCIAQFGSLRKLHLTLEMSLITYVCFEQLAKVSQLRHLALQCRRCGISCANVILSNQATLRSITLASCSWSLDTYAALNKASAVMVLSVRVGTMTESDARILGNLKTPQSLRLELQDCGQMGWRAMEALSSGQAKIMFLSLWRMPPNQGLSYWMHLMPMPYLTTLVMGNSMHFNGRSVQKQPSVSTLYLVDCNVITEQGVANIVDMFPGLNTVLLCKEARYRTEPHDSRTVAQQLMFLNYHSGLPADSTSTNELSVQLATVVGRNSGLQLMSNVQTISSRRDT